MLYTPPLPPNFKPLNPNPKTGIQEAFRPVVADDLTEMCSGSEEGSYLRLVDLCITQLSAWEL